MNWNVFFQSEYFCSQQYRKQYLKIRNKTKSLQESPKEADPHGHAHASQTRARKVMPVKDMTSVRAWACPKMFSRVVGFRRSAGLCDEIIRVSPWGRQKLPACFHSEVIRVPIKWRNSVFGRLQREVCVIVFPEWCRILGLGGTGPASKSDWQVKKRERSTELSVHVLTWS